MACGTPVVTANVSSLPEVVGDSAVQVNPENVFVMRLQPNWSRFTNNATATAQFRDYFRRLLESASQQPGVVDVAVSSTYPLNPVGITRGPNNVHRRFAPRQLRSRECV